MASDRRSLQALKKLIADTDLILETPPKLPKNRTACRPKNPLAALGFPENHAHRLVRTDELEAGRVSGNGRQAVQVFGGSADTWLVQQAQYDLAHVSSQSYQAQAAGIGLEAGA